MGILTDILSVVPVADTSMHSRMESYLDQDLFFLVIQPVVDFRTGGTFTGEALARLNHPKHGIIPPDEFIPLIDATGLYARFDVYIFRKCCIWLHQAAEEGKRFDCLSCNFSRKTLSQKGIAQELIGIAERYAIPGSKLGIEITEWKQAVDIQQLRENLMQLKEAGFRIILDDYGSGVTSENDLSGLPLDIVKLDRSLLLNAVSEEENKKFRTLVSELLRMGVEVVCEGIETEVQGNFAKEAGCHYGQGYLYFSPVFQDKVFERIYQRFRNEA